MAARGARFRLDWTRHEPPLPPVAVTGAGDAAEALVASARWRVGQGAVLRVAAQSGRVVIIGEAADLPWAGGACYLGWDCGLLVPTTRRPVPSAALWRDHLLGAGADVRPGRDDGHGPRTAVLLPGRALLFDVPARPVDVAGLDMLIVTGSETPR